MVDSTTKISCLFSRSSLLSFKIISARYFLPPRLGFSALPLYTMQRIVVFCLAVLPVVLGKSCAVDGTYCSVQCDVFLYVCAAGTRLPDQPVATGTVCYDPGNSGKAIVRKH